MELLEVYKIVLVVLLIACAVSVNLTRSLLSAVIIFMSYSSIMCLLWILMESPDLAITEAAVGAGVSGFLFLVTLKKLRQIRQGTEAEEPAPTGSGGLAGAVFNVARAGMTAAAESLEASHGAGPSRKGRRGGGKPSGGKKAMDPHLRDAKAKSAVPGSGKNAKSGNGKSAQSKNIRSGEGPAKEARP